MNSVRLTPEEFDRLLDYSCTMPTGMQIGDKWKKRHPYQWMPDKSNSWFLAQVKNIRLNLSGSRIADIEWNRIICPERGAFGDRKERELPVHLL